MIENYQNTQDLSPSVECRNDLGGTLILIFAIVSLV